MKLDSAMEVKRNHLLRLIGILLTTSLSGKLLLFFFWIMDTKYMYSPIVD